MIKPRLKKVYGMWECKADGWIGHGFSAREAYATWQLSQLPQVQFALTQQNMQMPLEVPWWNRLIGLA